MQKIAILADSGCDIPPSLAKERGIYIIPLKINYTDGEYRDGVDITPEEVYDKLKQEIPKTSLPSGAEIADLFEKIKADGFTEVLCVTLSSGLSGTHNAIRLVAEETDGLSIRLVDTKNIAIGSGFVALYAQDLADAGVSLEAAYQKAIAATKKSTVFFCVDTLEYLRKGGRIGLVASFFGTRLNLKPVITCNEEGVYYTASKARGKKQAIEKMIALATEKIGGQSDYEICTSNGGASQEEFVAFQEEVAAAFPNAKKVYETNISPTLGVHTGPGLLGLGVSLLVE